MFAPLSFLRASEETLPFSLETEAARSASPASPRKSWQPSFGQDPSCARDLCLQKAPCRQVIRSWVWGPRGLGPPCNLMAESVTWELLELCRVAQQPLPGSEIGGVSACVWGGGGGVAGALPAPLPANYSPVADGFPEGSAAWLPGARQVQCLFGKGGPRFKDTPGLWRLQFWVGSWCVMINYPQREKYALVFLRCFPLTSLWFSLPSERLSA